MSWFSMDDPRRRKLASGLERSVGRDCFGWDGVSRESRNFCKLECLVTKYFTVIDLQTSSGNPIHNALDSVNSR